MVPPEPSSLVHFLNDLLIQVVALIMEVCQLNVFLLYLSFKFKFLFDELGYVILLLSYVLA